MLRLVQQDARVASPRVVLVVFEPVELHQEQALLLVHGEALDVRALLVPLGGLGEVEALHDDTAVGDVIPRPLLGRGGRGEHRAGLKLSCLHIHGEMMTKVLSTNEKVFSTNEIRQRKTFVKVALIGQSGDVLRFGHVWAAVVLVLLGGGLAGLPSESV